MSNFDFQLAYTIKPHTARDDADAAQARVHLRENLGLDTVEHIETTLLGTAPRLQSASSRLRN